MRGFLSLFYKSELQPVENHPQILFLHHLVGKGDRNYSLCIVSLWKSFRWKVFEWKIYRRVKRLHIYERVFVIYRRDILCLHIDIMSLE